MNDDQLRQRVRMAAERAGLQKRVHLHLFCTSRAPHTIQQNNQGSVIEKMPWGNLNTSMFTTAIVLSEGEIDAGILGNAGIERRETQPDPLAPVPCPHCHAVGAPNSQFCSSCGLALSAEAGWKRKGARGIPLAEPPSSSSNAPQRSGIDWRRQPPP